VKEAGEEKAKIIGEEASTKAKKEENAS